MREPRFVFVVSPYQNAFFFELVEAFTDALIDRGVAVATTTEPDQHEVADDDVFVLLPPHEYVALEGPALVDDELVARRTIGITAEQPHQQFFDRNARIAGQLGAVFDFSPLAVEAYASRGIAARHQPFGYVPAWDRMSAAAPASAREVPALYLGNKRPRRLHVLAEAADALVRHRAHLLISDNDQPNVESSPTFLAGEAKRDRLARTRLVINVHQSDEPYFEWLRFADAVHCGAAVLTEASVATAPFIDGVHFESYGPSELASALDRIMTSPARLDELASAAYAQMRAAPLSTRLDGLVDAARTLLQSAPPSRLPGRVRRVPFGRDRTVPEAPSPWRPPRRSRLRSLGRDRLPLVIAPPGTTYREAFELPAGAVMATCMADGTDADGSTSLEGLWAWEPWRLREGQHLGRVVALSHDLSRAVDAWIREPWVIDHRYAAVQLFAAVHGIVPSHVPRPLATLHGRAVDPSHALPDLVAQRCRQILGAADRQR